MSGIRSGDRYDAAVELATFIATASFNRSMIPNLYFSVTLTCDGCDDDEDGARKEKDDDDMDAADVFGACSIPASTSSSSSSLTCCESGCCAESTSLDVDVNLRRPNTIMNQEILFQCIAQLSCSLNCCELFRCL